MSEFKKWTTEQKKQYAKQFTARERQIYQRAKRNGFLEAVHNPKVVSLADYNKGTVKGGSGFMSRNYSKEELNNLFDDVFTVKIR